MATFDGLISNGNITLTPDELSAIFSEAAQNSVVMSLGSQLRNMTTSELKLKVSTALPEVFFVGTKGASYTNVSGTVGSLKPTTTSTWENVSIYAGELAAIVVVPNNTFNDANFDIFGEIRRQMPTAIGKKFDTAVLHGTHGVDVPYEWSDGITVQCPAAMQFNLGANGDIYDDILGVSGTYARVEARNYDVNGNVALLTMKGKMRALRQKDGSSNQTGLPILQPTVASPVPYTFDGVPTIFPRNGGLDATKAKLISGDWSQLVWSIRQDVAFDVFTAGVIQDDTGAITHNLLQEDLTALRVTFRMAWGLPTPADWMGTASRFPFSVIK